METIAYPFLVSIVLFYIYETDFFVEYIKLFRLGKLFKIKDIYFLIKGFDQLGLWLEHPGVIIAKTEDNSGKPIPSEQIKKEQIDANFLVTWDNINTIMHYPNREGYDFPSEFDIEIGFKK